MTSDQFWSIFAMPIGLLVCFGPAVAVWLAAEWRDARRDRNSSRR
jgi:hypothetical protein